MWLFLLHAAFAAPFDWEAGPGYRSAPVVPVSAGARAVGFTLQPPAATGVGFANLVPEQRHLTNQILLNGSGVAAGDVDGDGWCDLFFAGIDRGCRLYRNLGNWKFADVTEAAGVGCAGMAASGAALADTDGDGDLDLLVNSVGNGAHVFVNQGQGRFVEAGPPLNGTRGGTSLALADVDGDGFLDLYLANYRTSALMDNANARATFARVGGQLVVETLNGRPTTAPDLTNRFVISPEGSLDELGEPDALYRNLGGTNWEAVGFTGGRFLDESGRPFNQPLFDWGLTAAFRDVNGDARPDLYVCNDFQSPDRFWINQGDGVFRLVPRLAQRKTSLFSMAVDFADVDRDGRDDFLVLDMLSREHVLRQRYLGDVTRAPRLIGVFDDRPQYGLDTLFLNRGDGTFAEVAQFAGLEAADWAWSCIFVDVDLDGWEDLLVANGMERAARDMDVAERLKALRAARRLSDAEVFNARRMFPRLATPNLAFRNRGDLTFEEMGAAWGFDLRGVSQGMALADLDNDGDLDVVMNNFNAPASVYRNESPAPRVAVRLRGRAPNTRGIGARISISVPGGAVPAQSQEITAGGRYLSSDDPMRVFAAGGATNRLTIEVTWRSGRRSVAAGVPANRLYEIDETASEISNVKSEPPGAPWFEDVSALIAHRHHEEPFDDFVRQPLLPNLLSQLGPGVAWFDLDADGREDLIIGTGQGGKLGIYRNQGTAGFAPVTSGPLDAPCERETTAVVGWHPAPGAPALLVGLSHYEEAMATGPALRQLRLTAPEVKEPASAIASCTGPIALADVDGDRDLDLFLGGRVVPGRYPEPASSLLLRNDGGQLVPDPANTKVLDRVGLVSGAVWSDLNGDGWPELILACEWGPLRVFRNRGGRLEAWDSPVTWSLPAQPRRGPDSTPPVPATLAGAVGWWNSVAAGDFDGDGRMDLVAGNWGRNTKYERHRDHPLELFAGDFGRDGRLDLIEAYFDPGLRKIVPARQLDVLGRSLPFLRERFPSHRAFSLAGVEEMLGDRWKTAQRFQATTLESALFLNRGDHWDARPLPFEAQVSPVFGLCVADADGDGREDLFLAQNFFATQPETTRYDAGRGAWLQGDGRGGFRAVPGQESGVAVDGEQRGAAVCDYDADGRTDLVVTQNGADTRLFRNRSAKPGLRVRLHGPRENPGAVGAQLRLGDGPDLGPAREIHAGAGYWSQDSSIQVVSRPRRPTAPEDARNASSQTNGTLLWIRWPGGQITSGTVPAGAREVTVETDGTIAVTPAR